MRLVSKDSYNTGYSFNDRRIKFLKNRRRKRRMAIVLAAYAIGVCNNSYNLDQLFDAAAATCPALSQALPGVSGKDILKGLAKSESGLNPNAVSQPGFDGSYSYGIMQVNASAHPEYYFTSDVRSNIRIGTADLCSKLMRYGNLDDAIAHYKGWYGYKSCPASIEQTNTAINLMEKEK